MFGLTSIAGSQGLNALTQQNGAFGQQDIMGILSKLLGPREQEQEQEQPTQWMQPPQMMQQQPMQGNPYMQLLQGQRYMPQQGLLYGGGV